MKTLPEFAPYRCAAAPKIKRWVAFAAALLLLTSGGVLVLQAQGLNNSGAIAGLFFGLMMLLAVCFAVRVLYYRVAQHNAEAYQQQVEQVLKRWWWEHRQPIGLVDYVLVGPAGATAAEWLRLVSRDHRLPVLQEEPDGKALRQRRTFAIDSTEREQQLARIAVLQWQAQSPQSLTQQPDHCYWLGTMPAWQAFVEQMAASFPGVTLPLSPEPWKGIESLTTMIDQLQGADSQALILCAGSRSLPSTANSTLPAGEAAAIWLLGQQGRVQFSRGEYVQPEKGETAAQAAQRAMAQSALEQPPESCFLFTQHDLPALSESGWDVNPQVQDLNWGFTGEMETMVVMTLAAVLAEQHAIPCGWVASDPLHSLALGIVKPYGSGI